MQARRARRLLEADARDRADADVQGGPKIRDRYRGGCTLLFDLNTSRLNYLVRKRLLSQSSIENQAKVQLAAMARAAEQGQVFYPPGDPAGRGKAFAIMHRYGRQRSHRLSNRLAAPGQDRPGRGAAGSQSAGPAADESFHKSASDGNGARASVRYGSGARQLHSGQGEANKWRRLSRASDRLRVVLGTEGAVDAMTRVVENLVIDTDQKVDVIAITHEHWDHLSGFIQAKELLQEAHGGLSLGRMDRGSK